MFPRILYFEVIVLIDYISANRYPSNDPPRTIKALLIFLNPNIKIILSNAIEMVRQSVMVSFPIVKQTAIIIATDATFTASKKVENNLEFLIFFTNGLSNATNTKDGRKIPMVEIRHPTNRLFDIQ